MVRGKAMVLPVHRSQADESMDLRLAAFQGDVSNQREKLDLFLKLDRC
jgi:hypothetical protein